MAGYSKRTLIQKLGIKRGMHGIFLHTPKELAVLFKNAPLITYNRLSGTFDYIHLFATNEYELRVEFMKTKKYLRKNGIMWISWPKAKKLNTNLDENMVRDIGLEIGLVDVKVAAIDDTWSGLKFVYRIKDR